MGELSHLRDVTLFEQQCYPPPAPSDGEIAPRDAPDGACLCSAVGLIRTMLGAGCRLMSRVALDGSDPEYPREWCVAIFRLSPV